MAREWAEQGREFSLDISSYGRNDRDSALHRLQVLIMAGQAPDIIMLDHAPWSDTISLHRFLGSGAFADIWELINNCPYTNRDDFYTNILDAWEVDGKLHALPVTFGFDYVGINATLPQSIIDQFNAYDFISMHQLLQLYLELQEHYYEDYGHLAIFNNLEFFSPFHIIAQSLNGFVDFENRISTIMDDEFIALLENWRRVFYGRGLFDFRERGRYLSAVRPTATMVTLSMETSRYVFRIENHVLLPINALFPNSNPYFIYHIPVTDEHGRLRQAHPMYASGVSGDIPFYWGAGHLAVPLITASADGAVAWEFLRHLLTAFITTQLPDERNPWHRANTLATPINRDYFADHMWHIFEFSTRRDNPFYWCPRRPRFDTEDERMDNIEMAISRLAGYNEMPVTSPFFLPSGLFSDLLDTFLRAPDDFMGARDVAQQLHNRVALWLIEP